MKVAALSLGQTLARLVTLLTGVVLARLLSKADFGTYRQVFLAYDFVAPLLTLALPTAIYWYMPRAKGEERTVLTEVLTVLCVLGLAFSVFLATGGGSLLALRFNNPELEFLLKIIIPYPLFALPANAISPCLVSQNQTSILATYNVISQLLLGVAVICVCFIDPITEYLVITNVIIQFLIFLVGVRLMLNACPGRLQHMRVSRIIDMLKYSIPVGLATMMGTLTLSLDKVIVAAFCSPEEFAVYSIGATEIPLINIITGSISTVILADMSLMCHENRKHEALSLFHKAATQSALVLLPSLVFFFFAAEPLIKVLFSSKYSDSIVLFRLYLMILPSRIVYYGVALIALGKTKSILARSIMELFLNGILALFFVRQFGYVGAVYSTITTIYVFSIPFNFFTIAKGFEVQASRILPIKELLIVAGAACLASPLLIIQIWLTQYSSFVQLIILSILYWPLTIFIFFRLRLLPLPEKMALLFTGLSLNRLRIR